MGFEDINIQIHADATKASLALDSLENSLKKLKNTSKGGAGLTSTVNQVNKLSKALSEITVPKTQTLTKLASSLSALGDVNKATGLNSVIRSLTKLPEVMTKLSNSDIGGFVRNIERLTAALTPLASKLEVVGNKFASFPAKINKAAGATQNATVNMTKMGALNGILKDSKFLALGAKLGIVTMAARTAGRAIAGWMNESNQYIENLNLFSVTMGSYADTAIKYAHRVQDVLGVDASQWMRHQGILQQIMTGFGVMENKATSMSTTLTQVGYDISSFFNLPIDQAMLKLQSGIAGELEPLRRIGYALDVATMQQWAYAHGIDIAVNKMTQAQKAQIRFALIMEQSRNVMGDMARTVLTPANAMRILQGQIIQLKRALGNIFIPILLKVLPYIQAFVVALTELANRFAVWVGFKMPKIDYSTPVTGIGAAVDQADNYSNSLDGLYKKLAGVGDETMGTSDNIGTMEKASKKLEKASKKTGKSLKETTKAAKKLKSITAGFDELNIFNKDQDNTLGDDNLDDLGLGKLPSSKLPKMKKPPKLKTPKLGGMDGLGGMDLPIDPSQYAYDFLGDIDKSNKLLVEKIKNGLSKALDVFVWFMGALAGLKVYSFIAGNLDKIKILFPAFSKWLGGWASQGVGIGAVAAVVAIMVGRFLDLLKNSEEFRKGLEVVWNGIKEFLSYMANTIGDIAKAMFDALPDWLKDGLEEVGKFLGDIAEALDLDLADLAITIAGIAMLFNPLTAPLGIALLVFEGITIALRAIGEAASPALDKVDVFGEGVSEMTKAKLEPFLETMEDIEGELMGFDITDKVISEDDVKSIGDRLEKVNQSIIDELDADKNQALKDLEPLKHTMSPEKFEKYKAATVQYHEDLQTQVRDNEARIQEILKTAQEEKRTLYDSEQAEIQRLNDENKEIAIRAMSETESETMLIMQRLKSNAVAVSVEQASGIIESAIKTRDAAILEAEAQYDGVVDNAAKMLTAGKITKDEYDFIVSKAKEAKTNSIKEAREQYGGIVKETKEKLGEQSGLIDYETGKQKTKWEFWWGKISKGWTDFWKDIGGQLSKAWDDLARGTNNFMSELGGGLTDAAYSIGNTVVGVFNTVLEAIESLIRWMFQGINKLLRRINNFGRSLPGVLQFDVGELDENFSIGRVSYFGDRGRKTQRGRGGGVGGYAEGGFPASGEMFVARENGIPELVGSFGGRTGVANNDQIIEGIKQGVMEAMMSAGGQGADVNVYIDGERVAKSVERYQRNRGYQPLPGGQYSYS